MDGRGGGCCIAKYGGGGYVASKADRIMLRFRPIAPKPAVGGSVSGNTSDTNADSYVGSSSGKPKRRCVRGAKRCGKKRSLSAEKADVAVVTLPLLPETPDRKESPAMEPSLSPSDLTLSYAPIWFREYKNHLPGMDSGVHVVTPQPVRPAWSCVTVECVTDTCMVGCMLGSTEEEVRRSLDVDTSPGFISDGLDRVRWTNAAYRKMVGQMEGETVALAIKDRLPETLRPFSCRVRLQYTCQKERNSLAVPCDAWRIGGGVTVWRLDVRAALSLGR